MSELQEQLAALRARIARVRKECVEKYEKPARAASKGYFEGIDGVIHHDEVVVHADDFSATVANVNESHSGNSGSIRRAQGAPLYRNPREREQWNIPNEPKRTRFHVEDWLPGQEMETQHGKHYETETLYARHRRHGSAEIGMLNELPADLLEILSGGAIRDVPPDQWAFLDTETTGLAGGTGTCAFLVGVGRITSEGFHVRQFFMRDYGEEASLLQALTHYLEPFRVLITYNGRTFDQPLLETRFRLNRARPPFGRLEHLDLLHGARRLWKLRYENCKLVQLEQQVLGFERRGDVPGAMIPYIYFEYLRSGEMARLLPVFHHNALDILTLACLTGIVPYAFKNPTEAFSGEAPKDGRAPLRHGAEMTGIARWLRDAGELEQARALFRQAVDTGLPDDILFRTLWDVAALERKLGCDDAALSIWKDLAESKNSFQAKAFEELAKHHEHRSKDYALALEMTRGALALGTSGPLRKREERLLGRVAK